jgi:N-acetylglucosaminyl-diphospho-decaprenol L-rhamnosyltransferase
VVAVTSGDVDGMGGVDRLALVIVNYGSSALLAANLVESGLRAVVDRVVVVDNPSSDAETRRIRELCTDHGWDLVALPANVGFGAGVNAGAIRARELGCTVMLVLNPDATIDAASVRTLMRASRAEPTALVGPRILRGDGSTWFAGAVLDTRRGTTRRARNGELVGDRTWQTGACFVAPLEMWHAVGGFDDDYFMYWEDIDLSWRWREAGGRLVFHPDATAVHDAGGTQPGTGKSPLYVYYNCRNRLLFARKRLASRSGRRWWRGSIAYAWTVATRGSRRMLARHPLLIWSAVRGTFAGAFGRSAPRRTARGLGSTTVLDHHVAHRAGEHSDPAGDRLPALRIDVDPATQPAHRDPGGTGDDSERAAGEQRDPHEGPAPSRRFERERHTAP